MSKSALILRHLAFEDLGSFGPVLEDEGYRLNHAEAGIDTLPDPLDPDLGRRNPRLLRRYAPIQAVSGGPLWDTCSSGLGRDPD